MESVLRAENVSKIFDMGGITQVRAVDGITLDVKKGEFISIMGPSGSGKTTFLDILSALLRPTSGEIFIKGKPISKMDDNELASVRGKTIGFVFQTFNLIPRMDAVENVAMPLWFLGVEKNKRIRIAEELLREVGLSDRMHHKPTELSGGQRQRVAIARALAVNPDIIVADEPTGNLDSAAGEQVLEIIDRLHEEKGKTVLMVTHERYVGERAEKILHLKDGKICQVEEQLKKHKERMLKTCQKLKKLENEKFLTGANSSKTQKYGIRNLKEIKSEECK